ncbi:MAG: hypothetical protein GXP54_07120, partial [Deltaproteobacteria bacterium]|nr:hypothetical protein [Deltaproteobacteria bacterium]
MTAVVIVMGLMAWYVSTHLHFDNDMVSGLPHGDPVLDDTRQALTAYPLLERVVVDLSLDGDPVDTELLVQAAETAERVFDASRVLRVVSPGRAKTAFLSMASWVADNLPGLFSRRMLEKRIVPLLRPESVRRALEAVRDSLAGLTGQGDTRWISRD